MKPPPPDPSSVTLNESAATLTDLPPTHHFPCPKCGSYSLKIIRKSLCQETQKAVTLLKCRACAHLWEREEPLGHPQTKCPAAG
jgi:predicted RNA-binding Zn-ribbon protein involved in translation (DUF1610 family)